MGARRSIRAIVVAVGAAILVSACGPQPVQPGASSPAASGGPAATTAALPEGGTMRVRINNANLSDFDVLASTGAGGSMIANYARDRLIYIDTDGSYKPWVAKSWTTTPSSVTFTIKDGVKCHDGTPLDATAIADFYRWYLDPAKPSVLRPRNFGPGPWTVTADTAAKTVKIVYEGQPYGDNALYGYSALQLVCPAGWKDPQAQVKNLIIAGSGPYIIKPEDIRQGEGATARINPDWNWGPWPDIDNKRVDRPKAIEFQVITNDTTAANLVTTGGIDAAGISGADVQRLRNDKSLTEWSGAAPGLWQATLNHRPNRPTADKNLRQAIYMVIDQKDFIQAAWNGLAKGSPGLVVPDSQCYYDPTNDITKDRGVDKAKAFLLANGYKVGSNGKLQKPDGGPLQLILLGVNGSNHGNGEDYVLAQLTAMGTDVKMNKVELGAWLAALNAGDFDISITHTNPINLLTVPSTIFGKVPPAGSNYGAISDPEIDRLVPAAIAATGSDYCKLWQGVQKRYLTEYHIVPLGTPTSWAFSKNFTWRAPYGGPNVLGAGVDPTSVRRIAQ